MSGLTPIILSNKGKGVTLVCTDATGATQAALVGDGDAILVSNIGNFTAFVSISTGDTTAVAPGATGSPASFPVLPRVQDDQIANRLTDGPVTHASAVCAAGETTTIVIHRVQR
ncbi:MAG: hypothetical protein KIS73_27015 [Enhydrobacter sp.]|nr:hypothetical protein [Enhydrobacter sp.]